MKKKQKARPLGKGQPAKTPKQGTPKMEAAMNAKKDVQGLAKPDALRYQAWRPTAQTGRYLIDEQV